MKSIIANGKPADDSASKVCILYDPRDGHVVHVHGVTVLHGGKQVTEAELVQRATNHARAQGHSIERLKPLHVPLSAIRSHGVFKVNEKGDGLVTVQPPVHPRQLLERHRKTTATRN